MSLFDMAEQMLAGQGGGNQNALGAVMNMVNNHPGGLPGLVSAFEQNGLGGAMSSWVSNGPNQAVSGQQVQGVMGTNVPPEMASGIVAQVLPGIINHLTPNGQVPSSGSNLMELGEGLLKNFMK